MRMGSADSEATLKSTDNIIACTVLECKNAFKEERVKYCAHMHGGIVCTIANTTPACSWSSWLSCDCKKYKIRLDCQSDGI